MNRPVRVDKLFYFNMKDDKSYELYIVLRGFFLKLTNIPSYFSFSYFLIPRKGNKMAQNLKYIQNEL